MCPTYIFILGKLLEMPNIIWGDDKDVKEDQYVCVTWGLVP